MASPVSSVPQAVGPKFEAFKGHRRCWAHLLCNELEANANEENTMEAQGSYPWQNYCVEKQLRDLHYSSKDSVVRRENQCIFSRGQKAFYGGQIAI